MAGNVTFVFSSKSTRIELGSRKKTRLSQIVDWIASRGRELMESDGWMAVHCISLSRTIHCTAPTDRPRLIMGWMRTKCATVSQSFSNQYSTNADRGRPRRIMAVKEKLNRSHYVSCSQTSNHALFQFCSDIQLAALSSLKRRRSALYRLQFTSCRHWRYVALVVVLWRPASSSASSSSSVTVLRWEQ